TGRLYPSCNPAIVIPSAASTSFTSQILASVSRSLLPEMLIPLRICTSPICTLAQAMVTAPNTSTTASTRAILPRPALRVSYFFEPFPLAPLPAPHDPVVPTFRIPPPDFPPPLGPAFDFAIVFPPSEFGLKTSRRACWPCPGLSRPYPQHSQTKPDCTGVW